jgi:hypothetical protein
VRVRRAVLVLAVCAAGLIGASSVVATTGAPQRPPRVVPLLPFTSYWDVGYHVTVTYSNSSQGLPPNYCNDAYHEKVDAIGFSARFARVGFSMRKAQRLVVKRGPTLGVDSKWNLTGSYHPDNDCAQPVQPVSCSGSVGFKGSSLAGLTVHGSQAVRNIAIGTSTLQEEGFQTCASGSGFGGIAALADVDPFYANVTASVSQKLLYAHWQFRTPLKLKVRHSAPEDQACTTTSDVQCSAAFHVTTTLTLTPH